MGYFGLACISGMWFSFCFNTVTIFLHHKENYNYNLVLWQEHANYQLTTRHQQTQNRPQLEISLLKCMAICHFNLVVNYSILVYNCFHSHYKENWWLLITLQSELVIIKTSKSSTSWYEQWDLQVVFSNIIWNDNYIPFMRSNPITLFTKGLP